CRGPNTSDRHLQQAHQHVWCPVVGLARRDRPYPLAIRGKEVRPPYLSRGDAGIITKSGIILSVVGCPAFGVHYRGILWARTAAPPTGGAAGRVPRVTLARNRPGPVFRGFETTRGSDVVEPNHAGVGGGAGAREGVAGAAGPGGAFNSRRGRGPVGDG